MSQPGHLSIPPSVWRRLVTLAESRHQPIEVTLLAAIQQGLVTLESAADARPLIPRRSQRRYTDAG
ncbi:MAG: hypothetical protein IT177_11645 [Acidobacteria bacterium]|nr:hypothetical protein [Acidobacteriota bacterium]